GLCQYLVDARDKGFVEMSARRRQWVSNGTARPRGSRAAVRRSLRPQLELLEGRLAPATTLPLVAQGTLPFGIPVVAWTPDGGTTAANVFTLQLAGLGVDHTRNLTVVFHYEGASNSAPTLQFWNHSSQSWQDVQGSSAIAGSMTADVSRHAITVVLDETSNPAL